MLEVTILETLQVFLPATAALGGKWFGMAIMCVSAKLAVRELTPDILDVCVAMVVSAHALMATSLQLEPTALDGRDLRPLGGCVYMLLT